MGVKRYFTISAYPAIKIMHEDYQNLLIPTTGFVTDDAELQATIEETFSFKKGFIKLDEKFLALKEDDLLSAIETVSTNPVVAPHGVAAAESIQGSVSTGLSSDDKKEEDEDNDDFVPAQPGESYPLYKLQSMKVVELRGICGRENIDFKGLKKKQLVNSIIAGYRKEE